MGTMNELPMNRTSPISVVILTYNEEANIRKCIESIIGWAQEIQVLDSFSTDKTLDIAREYSVTICQNKYEGHAQQWSFALKHLQINTPWIFAMDADFVMSAKLKDAISNTICKDDSGINGYYVRHKQIFRGKFIRHGTIYPRYWLRMFRHDCGYVDEHDLVDLHFYVNGETAKIECDLIEDNQKENDIGFWVTKQCKFAKRQAEEECRRRFQNIEFPVKPSLFATPDQRTLFLKKYWYKLPLFVRPFIYFFYRYFLRLGFLDGKQGFIYHFTQAFLYRLLVDIELDDLLRRRKEIEKLPDSTLF